MNDRQLYAIIAALSVITGGVTANLALATHADLTFAGTFSTACLALAGTIVGRGKDSTR